MFQTIQKEGVLNSGSCFTSLVASIVVHAAIACLLIIVPLTIVRTMEQQETLIVFTPLELPRLTPKAPPSAPKKSDFPREETKGTGFQTVIPVNEMARLDRIPKVIPAPVEDMTAFGLVPQLGNGTGSGVGSGTGFGPVGDGFVSSLMSMETIPTAPPKIEEKKPPLHVGTIEPSRIIIRIPPVYPILAKNMRVDGTVVLDVLIDEEGNVAEVSVESGHILLRDAAVEAVKQWKYTPTIQNGEPIPICGKVSVHFKIQR